MIVQQANLPEMIRAGIMAMGKAANT